MMKKLTQEVSSLNRRFWISYYKLVNTGKRVDGVPELIQISSANIRSRSILSTKEFPTIDSKVEKEVVPYNEPICGVLRGRWDKYRIPWWHSKVAKSLRDRFVYNRPWEETVMYKHALKEINNGNRSWRASSVRELNERCNDLDRLYHSMKSDGYMTQREIISKELEDVESINLFMNKIDGQKYPDECRVGIGRNGEIIRIEGGSHRISIAKILDISKIPVLVVVRHKKWYEIKNHLETASDKNDVPERYKKHMDHPDIKI